MNPWAERVAAQLAELTGWERPLLVTAPEFGARVGYSREQARHVLNRAAEYGYVERLRAVPGVRQPGDGSRYVYRPVPRACRVCGCTPERACPGGCWWAEFDLCTTCAEPAPPEVVRAAQDAFRQRRGGAGELPSKL